MLQQLRSFPVIIWQRSIRHLMLVFRRLAGESVKQSKSILGSFQSGPTGSNRQKNAFMAFSYMFTSLIRLSKTADALGHCHPLHVVF